MNILGIIKQKLYRKIVRTKWYKHLIDIDRKKALDIFYFQYWQLVSDHAPSLFLKTAFDF